MNSWLAQEQIRNYGHTAYQNLTFLLSASQFSIKYRTHIGHEICSIFLPICRAAMAVTDVQLLRLSFHIQFKLSFPFFLIARVNFKCIIWVLSFLEAVTYWDTDKKNIHAEWKMGTSNTMDKLN
jgi:hypothetical protein